MQKFTEIFEEQGTPYQCDILDIKRGVQSKYGPTNVVIVNHGGTDFEWWVKEDAFKRLFEEYDIGIGMTVNITLNAPSGKTKYPFYTMELPGDAMGSTRPAPKVNSQVVAKQTDYQAEKEKRDNVLGKRISLQGFTQALLERGMPIEEAKAEGIKLAKWVQMEADAWYTADIFTL